MPFDPDDPRLTAYALGELDLADRATIEAILRDDPDARDFVQGVEETARLLSEEFGHESTSADGLDPARRGAIEHRLASPPAPATIPISAAPARSRLRLLVPLAAVAGIAGLAVAVTLPSYLASRRARVELAFNDAPPAVASPSAKSILADSEVRDSSTARGTREAFEALGELPARAPADPAPVAGPVDAVRHGFEEKIVHNLARDMPPPPAAAPAPPPAAPFTSFALEVAVPPPTPTDGRGMGGGMGGLGGGMGSMGGLAKAPSGPPAPAAIAARSRGLAGAGAGRAGQGGPDVLFDSNRGEVLSRSGAAVSAQPPETSGRMMARAENSRRGINASATPLGTEFAAGGQPAAKPDVNRYAMSGRAGASPTAPSTIVAGVAAPGQGAPSGGGVESQKVEGFEKRMSTTGYFGSAGKNASQGQPGAQASQAAPIQTVNQAGRSAGSPAPYGAIPPALQQSNPASNSVNPAPMQPGQQVAMLQQTQGSAAPRGKVVFEGFSPQQGAQANRQAAMDGAQRGDAQAAVNNKAPEGLGFAGDLKDLSQGRTQLNGQLGRQDMPGDPTKPSGAGQQGNNAAAGEKSAQQPGQPAVVSGPQQPHNYSYYVPAAPSLAMPAPSAPAEAKGKEAGPVVAMKGVDKAASVKPATSPAPPSQVDAFDAVELPKKKEAEQAPEPSKTGAMPGNSGQNPGGQRGSLGKPGQAQLAAILGKPDNSPPPAKPPLELALVEEAAKKQLDEVDREIDGKKAELRRLVEESENLVKRRAREQTRVDRETYARFYDHPFLSVLPGNRLSTFSVDVDTGAYANVRRFLSQGQLPPPDACRIEEMLNYFRYDDPAPKGDEPFSVNCEVTASPWDAGHRLARVGLKGKTIDADKRPTSNLVFLIDVSGSMGDLNKLPLLKAGMKLLVEQLTENDRVAIVTYSNDVKVAFPSTACHKKAEILAAIDALQAGGGTNGGAGVQLAYKTAEDHFIKGGTNRVILATDGDFNVGLSKEELLATSEARARSGVFLTVIGFGEGNLQEDFMEQLADKGNGHYLYIDTIEEARKSLVRDLSGTLVTIAKDVKIQVEFNPDKVSSYRLIGYENRVMEAKDFRDDKKDAGEIGAGHSVTALYEIVPANAQVAQADRPLKYANSKADAVAAKDVANPEMLTVYLRYKKPDGDVATEISRGVVDEGRDFGHASADLKFSTAVAGFGMLLRGSPYRGTLTYPAVLEIAASALGKDPNGDRKGFLDLVREAARIEGGEPALAK